MSRDSELAVETYLQTEALPSLSTQNHFKLKGYSANGPLLSGGNLTIYHRQQDLSKHILKCLNDDETARLRVFETASLSHPGIVPFELYSDTRRNKSFMLMPALPSTLAEFPFLDPHNALRLLRDIGSAVEVLHSKGFAHCDIKPGNIGINSEGRFVLIDLGSVSIFGNDVCSTPAYIPQDVKKRSSAQLDWWMLAMTMAEKCCPTDCLKICTGPNEPTTSVVREHLNAKLPGRVRQKLTQCSKGCLG